MSDKKYHNLKIEKQPQSRIIITGEIDLSVVDAKRSVALKRIQDSAEMPGFRKGHIPEQIIVQKYGELAIFEEAVEQAMNEIYPAILIENNIDAIGEPHVHMTNMTLGSQPAFKIEVDVMPEIVLSDYKKIAKEVGKPLEKTEITEKDKTEAVNEVKKTLVLMGRKELKSGKKPEKPEDIEESDLPDLDDETLLQIGGYKNYAEFEEKLIESLKKYKESKEVEKRRLKIMEKLVEGLSIELPSSIINAEVYSMQSMFKHDLAQSGFTYENYLKEAKKTEEELLNEWRPMAENKAKTQLVLAKIASIENIRVNENEVTDTVNEYMEHNTSADRGKVYRYFILMKENEKVLALLDDLAEAK